MPCPGDKVPVSRARPIILAIVLACGLGLSHGDVSHQSLLVATTAWQASENEIDEALQRAAAASLGQQEGAIVVVDPQTGRIRAVVNQQLAFENAYAPGSTIKPFTALAALRVGLIDKNSTALCRQRFASKDFHTVCSHPRDLPPLNPTEAIAYSCNYYFGTLGQHLNEVSLSDTLSSFGFGKSLYSDRERSQTGKLRRGKVDPRNALGEGDYLQATPMQLIMAYSALVNGGHLLTPRVAPSSDFQIRERARLQIAPEQRELIVAGMRGAVVYGTAARSGLNSSSLNVFGKTGTSTPLKGFRTQGWFVGFASPANNENPSPVNVRLAVLVFLKHAHGSNAAALSRAVFVAYQRVAGMKDAEKTNDKEGAGTGSSSVKGLAPGKIEAATEIRVSPSVPIPVSPRPPGSGLPATVRVHLVAENVTKEMSLEDYVLGVVATEGSMENQRAALKALAVAVRTYAVRNAGRHTRDDYDFCTTTHCQRFSAGFDSSALRPEIIDAVRQTDGEVLRDEAGQVADSYFSASCGGVTANLQTLWGTRSPPYLRGVPDEYCAAMPHHSWTDVIPAERLQLALQSDQRTDPGRQLRGLFVARRDSGGRAELITIEGERRHTVSGWDLKIIVGRELGWNFLKSSRFEIARAGPNYIFRGSGFGHGLGLCQEGGHVMAQRGVNYRQILAKYFPGTTVVDISREGRIAAQTSGASTGRAPRPFQATPLQLRFAADLLWNSGPGATKGLEVARSSLPEKRTSLSSEHFRVSYPVTVPQSDAERILQTLETAQRNLLQKVSAAGIALGPWPSLEVFLNASTGDFVGRTGQPWWAAAATKGNLIELQPVAVLKRRGVLETTLRHELVHTLIDRLSHGRAPRWLAEGTALYFAGEGVLLARHAPQRRMTIAEIDNGLARASSAAEMRTAYAAAYAEVRELIRESGEASLWQRIAGSHNSG